MGAQPGQIMADAGIDPRGVWVSQGVDEQGGRTMVRLAQSGTEMAAINKAKGIDGPVIPARRPPPLPLPSPSVTAAP